jgi:GrpB-like predicted nucleotidyltransferase (UPF0157 family)
MSTNDSIILQKYSDEWPKLAAEEIERIRSQLFKSTSWQIEHVGSTSVPGLSAKPIIDLAIQVKTIQEGAVAVDPLESMGYSYWRDNPDIKHMFFVKGLPPQGSGRTHHVHIFESDRFKEYTRFRDALKNNPILAKDYEKLKVELAKKFEFDREAYTKAKSNFIRSVLDKT